MPQWAGSSWYYLAYILKNNDGTYLEIDSPEAKERFEKWLPVDLYIGGQEHAVLHLLYARFWHKVLFDLGIVTTKEPFQKVINQGMILGPDGQKMSKSKGNTINPDDIVKEFGADTLRVYEMFMGPFEDTKPWSERSVHGVRKWLDRVYRVYTEVVVVSKESKVSSEFNTMLKGINKDLESLSFNTAISKMMVFINALYKKIEISKEELKNFAIVLSLFAPHISEELLERLEEREIKNQTWPILDESKIKVNKSKIVIQVNGKLRDLLEFDVVPNKEEIIKIAKSSDKVIKFIEGKEIIKEIYVPNKIVNIVVK